MSYKNFPFEMLAKDNVYRYASEPRFFNPYNDVAFKKNFLNHVDLTISFLNLIVRRDGYRKIKNVDFPKSLNLNRKFFQIS